MANPEQRDSFGIIVSYNVKVKLYLGALGGELTAELPFILMHPKPDGNKMLREESVAIESFRQDTIEADQYKPSEDPIYEDFTRMRLQNAS